MNIAVPFTCLLALGYYIGFGDIFNQADLADKGPLAARLVAQFVAGDQLGWFSMGGVSSGPDYDTGFVLIHWSTHL